MPPRKVGTSHFPLSAEVQRQQIVRAQKTGQQSSGGKSGHRLSREQGAQAIKGSEGSFRGSGGKSGKTRGSRAGLLSANRNRARNP